MQFLILLLLLSPTAWGEQASGEEVMKKIFTPITQDIVVNYPIPSLRRKFVDAINDVSVRLKVVNRSFFGGNHGPVAFSGKEYTGSPSVVIVVENFLDRLMYASVAKKQAEYKEYGEDLFLALYLHEYYHIKKQGFYGGAKTNELLVRYESDGWAYTMKEIILPMQKNGRGKLLPGTFDDTILKLYREIKGNTRHPKWHQFFKETYTPVALPRGRLSYLMQTPTNQSLNFPKIKFD